MVPRNGSLVAAVDPGKFLAGVALHRVGTTSWWAGVVRSRQEGPRRWAELAWGVQDWILKRCQGPPQILVVERMQVYARDGSSKAEDLLDLQAVAGAVVGVASKWTPLEEILTPLPLEWKGQVPRDVTANRELSRQEIREAVARGDVVLPASKKEQGDVGAALGLIRWRLSS